ncbi:ComEA family DNA-binding protein [Microbacterium rhizomatis]|uniref:ComEA family DNA-binding protein n=1 Tax=Microbacterium rhizomatis TaxID=1631477 RepID=A0A5J5J6A7_9MICO|nr:ComEA family DNA-binding protein [Microbacterium rhizomatis]
MGLGAAVVVVLLALAVTVGIGIFRGAGAPVQSVGGSVSTAAPSAPPEAALYVHVSGSVVAPGLYVLAGDARVVDAVAAAGGFADGADTNGLNLARPLSDGEQLHVPSVGEVSTPAAPSERGGQTDPRVNLNTADATQLDALPRIGPAMAERIIQWREANGRFTSVEDLLAVPGIGDKMLESLRELVTI